MDMETFCLVIVLAPLVAAVVVGLWGNFIGKEGAHWISNAGVAISFFLSALILFKLV